MKKNHCIKIRIFALIILLMGIRSNAISQSNMNCKISITSPAIDGETVQADGPITGTASIPNGYYLWALVHRILPFKQQGLWWPQSNSEISPGGNWNCWVTYGQAKDVGFEFEIAVIVVDRTEHLKLQAYIERGDWSQSIKMPKTICPPVIRKVKKT